MPKLRGCGSEDNGTSKLRSPGRFAGLQTGEPSGRGMVAFAPLRHRPPTGPVQVEHPSCRSACYRPVTARNAAPRFAPGWGFVIGWRWRRRVPPAGGGSRGLRPFSKRWSFQGGGTVARDGRIHAEEALILSARPWAGWRTCTARRPTPSEPRRHAMSPSGLYCHCAERQGPAGGQPTLPQLRQASRPAHNRGRGRAWEHK
jgi:hypothetical protein